MNQDNEYEYDISVIIPFFNKVSMTLQCIKSIEHLPLKEIVLVNNNSDETASKAINNYIQSYANIRLLNYSHPFNYQKLNNWAVSQTNGRVIWLLNNDVELPKKYSEVVKNMYNNALKPDVGASGCVLLYEDGKTIQHAGVSLVSGGLATHNYYRQQLKHLNTSPIEDDRQFIAVTAASLMVERMKFNSVQGFDERFIVNGGDVDLCLRMWENGYKSILSGIKYGFMLHKESMSVKDLSIYYDDYYYSYLRYIKHFDLEKGDIFCGEVEERSGR